MKKLSYEYLKNIGVDPVSLKFWMDNFGNEEYDIDQVLKKIKKDKIEVYYWDVSGLIKNCDFFQTDKMVDLYISLNPYFGDVSCLIKYCEFCQTNKMLNFYISLKPNYWDVSWLINMCEYAKNHPLIKEYVKKNFGEEI